MAQSCCSFKISLIFFFNRGAQCNSVKPGVTLWICICLMWVKILAAAFCISWSLCRELFYYYYFSFYFFFPFQEGYKIVTVCVLAAKVNTTTQMHENCIPYCTTPAHSRPASLLAHPVSVRDSCTHHRPEGLQCSLRGTAFCLLMVYC